MIFGAIGLAAMAYGKTTTQPKLMMIGAVLIGYTFFITDPWLTLGIGVALCISLWYSAE